MPSIRFKELFIRYRTWKTAATRTQRLCLWTAGLAVALVSILLLSSLILSLNPYQPLYDYIAQMVRSQPDLEDGLDYAALANTYLEDSLDIENARILADWYDSASETEIHTLAQAYGDQSGAVASAIRLSSSLAYEIKHTQKSLAVTKSNPALAEQISAIRSQPENIQPEQLIAIWHDSKDMVQWINSLRAQIRTLSTEASPVIDDSRVAMAVQFLAQAPMPVEEGNLQAVQALTEGYASWQSLGQQCQSLEIQFANTVSVLSNLYQTIDSAYRIDKMWGYSFWASAALFVRRNTSWLLAIAAGLLVFSWVGLSGTKLRFKSLKPAKISRKMRTFSTRYLENPAPGGRGQTFLQDSRAFVERLVEPPKTRSGVRKGRLRLAQMVVVEPNGRREEISLPANGTFRIGNDASFQIYVPQSGAAYVEIWVRRAHAGYFLEVMFSDTPVRVNSKLFQGACALKHGDLIEIGDTSIIYLEK